MLKLCAMCEQYGLINFKFSLILVHAFVWKLSLILQMVDTFCTWALWLDKLAGFWSMLFFWSYKSKNIYRIYWPLRHYWSLFWNLLNLFLSNPYVICLYILGNFKLLPVHRLCWEKFGWIGQKADELLLPVLKEYNKREVRNFVLIISSLFLLTFLLY